MLAATPRKLSHDAHQGFPIQSLRFEVPREEGVDRASYEWLERKQDFGIALQEP